MPSLRARMIRVRGTYLKASRHSRLRGPPDAGPGYGPPDVGPGGYGAGANGYGVRRDGAGQPGRGGYALLKETRVDYDLQDERRRMRNGGPGGRPGKTSRRRLRMSKGGGARRGRLRR